ncbi:hypothetical protein FJT64_014322 [Amphibalanus amphitrite]|uniref:Uncharacterized protein n=1 Tax=Amphibalanus amphitrite TaxID=1232801 RepID=A0A6A4UZA3_AMPAM|nr:hypothetical protein FJT64_014322 [Amphibalanus amphitrite]
MAATSSHRVVMLAALLLTLLAILTQVRSAPLDGVYSPYSVAESDEAPEVRSPNEALLLRRLLEDIRSGQIKYRPRERRVPYPLGVRLYRRSRSFCLHLADASCKDEQFISSMADNLRFSVPGSSPGK